MGYWLVDQLRVYIRQHAFGMFMLRLSFLRGRVANEAASQRAVVLRSLCIVLFLLLEFREHLVCINRTLEVI